MKRLFLAFSLLAFMLVAQSGLAAPFIFGPTGSSGSIFFDDLRSAQENMDRFAENIGLSSSNFAEYNFSTADASTKYNMAGIGYSGKAYGSGFKIYTGNTLLGSVDKGFKLDEEYSTDELYFSYWNRESNRPEKRVLSVTLLAAIIRLICLCSRPT